MTDEVSQKLADLFGRASSKRKAMLTVRMDPQLYELLVQEAAAREVSLNKLAVAKLTLGLQYESST